MARSGGDLRHLQGLRRRLGRSSDALLASSNVLRRVVRELIQDGFATQTDPIGRRWAPRKKFYPWPILHKTGAMQEAWLVRGLRKEGVVFSNRQPYSGYHQDGTRYMSARKMIPDQSIPPRWHARIAPELERALADYFRQGRVSG